MPRGSPKSARRRKRKKKSVITARAKKEFSYRGKSLDELKELSIEELLPLLNARARRSLLRGLNDQQVKLRSKVESDKEYIKTYRRDALILPSYVGKKIGIYNGKEFKDVTITPEMVGHYLGEFAQTRKSVKHTGPGVGATRSSKFMPLK